MIPGEYILRQDPIVGNEGGKTRVLNVKNLGDRPIQVGSHYHFAEVNQFLELDRVAARGFRLDIPAGTAVRFEPGDARSVHLVEISGNREVYGLQNLINGPLGGVIPAIDTEAIGGTAGIMPLGEPEVPEGYDIDSLNVGHEHADFHTTYGWDALDDTADPAEQARHAKPATGNAGPGTDAPSNDEGEDGRQ